MVNIGVLGYGTVGSGVVEVIETNQASINKKAGTEVNVKYVLDLRDFPGTPIQDKIVHDINIILNDPEVNVVVEVMGGVEPAYTFVKNSLLAGKCVVTSNKALVAAKGAELLQIAKDMNVNFLFEASVGGGIPIIRPLNQCLTADVVTEIAGIMNGTTNYMLTKMSTEGSAYDAVLKEAQDMGYAERNPEADVEGYDACRKIAILSSIAYGSQVDFEDIHTEGITKITDMDFKYAAKLSRSIKLIAMSKNNNGEISAIVAPFMITPSNPLYAVNDVINGIHVTGNMVGDVTFVGAGAGKLPTASAVVGDVVECAKNLNENLGVFWESKKIEICDHNKAERAFYVRVNGILSEKLDAVKSAFGNVSVVELDGVANEFAVVTEVMTEGAFAAAVMSLDCVMNTIRIW